ncbi:hypothetical protein CRG98_019474 [Punica granatum]|uniref:Uncharacterized protein n=1 Tax=Punica granatum TaxID=22663 RepID=A0A2I0JW79_PUNGR|nr:hypothetical protein CRG98_019474 [Punica granatum]
MSLTNSTFKGRLADTRLPFQMATFCFSTPSIPVKSTSGTRGTWYTFTGAVTLTLAPILDENSSSSAEDGEVDASESDGFSATSQRILHLLRVRAAVKVSTEEEEEGGEKNRQVLGRLEIAAAVLVPAAGDSRASVVVVVDMVL